MMHKKGHGGSTSLLPHLTLCIPSSASFVKSFITNWLKHSPGFYDHSRKLIKSKEGVVGALIYTSWLEAQVKQAGACNWHLKCVCRGGCQGLNPQPVRSDVVSR